MKRLVVLVLLSALPARPLPLEVLSGSATLSGQAGARLSVIEPGQSLESPEGAVLRLGDGSLVRMAARTRLSLGPDQTLNLQAGRLLLESPSLRVAAGGLTANCAGTCSFSLAPERATMRVLDGTANVSGTDLQTSLGEAPGPSQFVVGPGVEVAVIVGPNQSLYWFDLHHGTVSDLTENGFTLTGPEGVLKVELTTTTQRLDAVMENGQQVEVAGRLRDGVLVAYSIKTITPGQDPNWFGQQVGTVYDLTESTFSLKLDQNLIAMTMLPITQVLDSNGQPTQQLADGAHIDVLTHLKSDGTHEVYLIHVVAVAAMAPAGLGLGALGAGGLVAGLTAGLVGLGGGGAEGSEGDIPASP